MRPRNFASLQTDIFELFIFTVCFEVNLRRLKWKRFVLDWLIPIRQLLHHSERVFIAFCTYFIFFSMFLLVVLIEISSANWVAVHLFMFADGQSETYRKKSSRLSGLSCVRRNSRKSVPIFFHLLLFSWFDPLEN